MRGKCSQSRGLASFATSGIFLLFALVGSSAEASLIQSLDGSVQLATNKIVLAASRNHRYQEWRARHDSGDAGGELPPDCTDWDALSEAYRRYESGKKSSAGQRKLLSASYVPSSYDLRTYNRVTPVRDQGAYDTCWAFSVIASFESRILTKEKLAIDLSENNAVTMNGRQAAFGSVGNVNQIMSYLLRWDGPALEAEDPYPSANSRLKLKPCRRLTDYIMLPPRGGALDNDRIKSAVMDYGAVRVSYYAKNGKYPFFCRF